MIVIAYGEEFECTRAVKGKNFIHLYDESGAITAVFEGINSFDGYSIIGGVWETPAPAPSSELSIWEDLDSAYREGVNSV